MSVAECSESLTARPAAGLLVICRRFCFRRVSPMAAQPFSGVLVPVLTPFTRSGDPDAERFVHFCRFLLDQGADGLAIFGTTSEANSMAGAERMALLDRLIDAGIPAARLMPGTGACSVTEAAS
jgi:4-hydroxy-tetrahydrodipicolinate synthase